MTRWSLERYRTEIITQTDLLRTLLTAADPAARVPTCPEWNLRHLLRHIGGVHRWIDTVVRTRATDEVPDTLVNEVFGYGDEDLAELGAWLGLGARRLTDVLAEAGPDARVWTVVPDQPLVFWARRALHETVVHRADAAWAVGARYDLDTEVALDALDEWMSFGSVPETYENEGGEPLLGPGRSIGFLAGDDPAGSWRVDLSGEVPRWDRGAGETAVGVRGSLTDLVLFLYGRPVADRIEVRGDAGLLELWLRRSRFWLR
ncbi:maleylpyruvate isomerase family mycothiol-dependent enzyme [Streptomyces griseus]|uniref:maleylpyruvate isomerase family mycothiol-dependent enzyme n=1 Tax=Streptomyces griseus TaxID=1911 RepID=UPI00055B34C0|nr:maleylpyruvate isomerase family mycothiol-dependent enzyme [Streptomyces griseus]